MIYYPMTLHKMKVFDGRCKIFNQLGESEKAAKEVLSLPIEPPMKEEEIMSVVKAIRKFFAS